VDDYPGYLLLVTCAAVPDATSCEPQLPGIDVLVGRNFVVTLHRGSIPALDEALLRWMRGGPLLSQGVGFLVYTILDSVIDSYTPVVDAIEEEIAASELAVFGHSVDEGLRNLLRLKRTLIALRRVLYPLREVFPNLSRPDRPWLQPMEMYLRDVSSHVLRLLDVLDTEREMVASALDATLTVSANRLNSTMKTLAVITIAMAVIGSVFGAYGMNFDALPLAHHPIGFWLVSVGTISLMTAALVIGKWRRWW
jgi:magnesium transporter